MSRVPATRAVGGTPHSDPAAGPRLSYLIKRVEQGSKSLIDEQLGPLGVTLNQYTALSVLRMRAGLSASELARRSFVTPQAMNQVIAGLEERNMLVREPDPAHRRILRAYLTPAGNRLLLRCDEVIDRAEAEMTEGLSQAQLGSLMTALLHCSEALDELHRPKGADAG